MNTKKQCLHMVNAKLRCLRTQYDDYCYNHKNLNHIHNEMDDSQYDTNEKYLNGKIYKLYHIDEPYIIYVGCTFNSLEFRLNSHITSDSGRKKNKHFNWYGWKGVRIELLENAPCDNRHELEVIEKYWIKKMKPELNTLI